MQATRGAFRFVTGKQDHSAYQLKTPYGTAAFAQSYDPDNGTGNVLAYAPTDQNGKNANARSSANAAYAQAVGRGAGSIVTFEVVSEEDKKKRRDKCDVRVKVEKGEAEFTTPDKKLHKVKARPIYMCQGWQRNVFECLGGAGFEPAVWRQHTWLRESANR